MPLLRGNRRSDDRSPAGTKRPKAIIGVPPYSGSGFHSGTIHLGFVCRSSAGKTRRRALSIRRRYPDGCSLPYSGSGFDMRNNYLEYDCGITAGTRPLPYSDSGSICQIKRLEALLDIFVGISVAKASLLVVLLALGLGASMNTELESHPLRQFCAQPSEMLKLLWGARCRYTNVPTKSGLRGISQYSHDFF